MLSFLKKREKATKGGGNIPPLQHIGIIMDGNGRWAKNRGLPREAGHSEGAKTFRKLVDYLIELEVPYVTVYAFSTENWKRPQSEVDGIMKLFCEYLHDGLENSRERNSAIRFLGDDSRFSPEIRELMARITEMSKNYKTHLNIAMNYGGRDDIIHSVNTLIAEGKTEITAEDISSRLYTSGEPDPDLIIRTGGEFRLSNFLTWQSVYSELYFTNKLWPDMTKADIDDAIRFFSSRQRRFGDVKSK